MEPDVKDQSLLMAIQLPENQEFAEQAKELGGVWDADTNHWQFPLSKANEVNQMVEKISQEKQRPLWSLTEKGNQVFLTCPESKEFASKAKELGGVWDQDAKRWEFPANRSNEVKQMAEKIFGAKDKPAWSLTEKGGQVIVKGPYNREFVDMARAIGGQFDTKSTSWSFNAEQKSVVTKMCEYAFEGKIPRKAMNDVFKDAMSNIAQSLPGWGKALATGGKIVGLLAAYGYSGQRGISTTMTMMNLAAGSLPKLKAPGLIGDTPMNAGGHVAFLEQMKEHQRQVGGQGLSR